MSILRFVSALSTALIFFWSSSWICAQSDRGVRPDEGIRFHPPKRIAITNARVFDSRGEIRDASLLINDGRITKVGQDIPIPGDAEVIDFEGDYLYPAFIDAYVEFGSKELLSDGQHWNSNVMPHRKMAESLQWDAGKLKVLREAGIGIVLAAPDEGIFKGQSCVLATAGDSLATAMLRSDGFQHVRLYPSRRSRDYPNSPMGAMALARQTLADASWYQSASQASAAQPDLAGPEYNSALAALLPVVTGKQTLVIDGSNELYALRADRIAREFSLRTIVRGSGREYRRLDAIAGMGRTLIVPVDFPDAPEVETEQQLADVTLQELMHWDLAPANPARLHQAGVSFVLSSDGLDSPKDFLSNLRKAVKAGLDSQVALRAVTLGAAQLLQLEDLAGTIERGKLANFLRVDGDLFKSDSTLKETWVQGERFELKPDEENNVAGRWRLELQDAPVSELELQIEGSRRKTSATLGTSGAFEPDRSAEKQAPDKARGGRDGKSNKVKLKNVSNDHYALSGSFDAGQLLEDKPGVAWLSATKLISEGEVELVGSIIWADGTSSSFQAEHVEKEPEQSRQPAEEPAPEPGLERDKEEAAKDETEEQSSTDDDADQEDNDQEKDERERGPPDVEVNFPLGAYGLPAKPAQPEWILFRNATIWTCSDQGILESADLLVHRGMIEAVGDALEVPEGCEIVDASGMHISPGIIDCHSHMATDGGVNESGQAITAEVRIGDFIDPNDITIYRQLAGGVTAANILHGSANPIGGQNQVIKLRWGGLAEELKMPEAPAGIKFALGENVKQSSRNGSTRYPQTRMGVEQILRDRFEAAKHYRQSWSDWMSSPSGLPPRKDYELEAIAEILEGRRWVHCHSYRQDEILATLRVLEEYGVTIGSLQHILEGYKVADAMAAHGATGSSFSDWWAYKFEVYAAIPYNGALMHRAGVIVSFNSDDGELARHLNHEAAKAVKYGGVPEEEALKFVTLNPARQLRIDQWVGSLEAGKQADFVLWNRSPLSTLSACVQTWIDGRKYFDREVDLERRREDESLRRRLIQKIVDSGAKSSPPSDDDPSYWWARHDEFCHHFDDTHDGFHHSDHYEQEEREQLRH
jgi:imidazolonepropionase-like amidohydrolase